MKTLTDRVIRDSAYWLKARETSVPKLRVHNFSISLDGYAAGPDQNLDDPLGAGGPLLHEWVFATRTGRRLVGGTDGGDEGLDDEYIARGDADIGATIMGRNMFGPNRGSWGDKQWKGWWGDDPPYHHPVFVLTHHPRPPIPMRGGTTFHFVDDGIEAALDRAFDAAGGKDVRLGGGVATIQQYLRAGLIDDMHLAIVPVLLGGGERLFDHLDGGPHGYECVEFAGSPSVAHVRLSRSST
jgi:dihydrofolate reductase